MSNDVVRLALYNEALALVGSRKLSALSENREPKRVLDSIWETNVRDTCLEMGQWNFAARISSLTYSPSIEPQFGYSRVFEKPSDLVLLMRMCSDEKLKVPLLDYADTAQFWFSDLDEIYFQYVSNDNDYGNDFTLWPESFKRYVASYLALQIAPRLAREKVAFLEQEMGRRLTVAKNKDAMKEPTKFQPVSSWQRARRGGSGASNAG